MRWTASYAADPTKSRGRRHVEPGGETRGPRDAFQRDRDRIVHAIAFRRLRHKTQVFVAPDGDHFRVRLTHSLEVAQIGRTIARALGLNEDLTEALCLAHDIGHPPFGHAGEKVLNELMRARGSSFNHNLQALRIVEQFESPYLDFPGLNLTFEVREGIIKHSRDYTAAEVPHLSEYLLDLRPPLESQLIDWVDEIAYNTADLDDAREAELLDLDALRSEVPLFHDFYARVDAKHPAAREKLKFNEAIRSTVDFLASDLIFSTRVRVQNSAVASVEDVRRAPQRLAGFSDDAEQRNAGLKRFLFAHIYEAPAITEDRDRSVRCLEQLFIFYLETPGSMPESHEESARTEPRHLAVCDYIAGMTDSFLLRQHREHFGASSI